MVDAKSARRLSQFIVVELRENLSQLQIAKKLKVPKTRIAKWEAGRTRITWLEFVDFALSRKIDVRFCFEFAFGYAGDIRDYSHFMKIWSSGRSAANIAKALHISPQTVRRWLNGQQVPRLYEVLQFMDCMALGLMSFVRCLLKKSIPEELITLVSDQQKFSEATNKMPWSTLVFMALDLEKYRKLSKHSDEVIAELTGLSLPTIRRCLEHLFISGLVKVKNGKFENLLAIEKIDLRTQTREQVLESKRFWLEVIGSCMSQPPPPLITCTAPHFVGTTSERGYERLFELMNEFYSRGLRILDEHKMEPSTRVACFNAQLFDNIFLAQHALRENDLATPT